MRTAVMLLVLAVWASTARAQWTVFRVEGDALRGHAVSTDTGDLRVTTVEGKEVVLPWRDVHLVRTEQFEKPSDPTPWTIGPWRFETRGGDRARGEIESWREGVLRCVFRLGNGAVVGSASISQSEVVALWRGESAWEEQARALRRTSLELDAAFVRDGESVKLVEGRLGGLEGQSLLFEFEGEMRRIALDRLVGVVARQGTPATEPVTAPSAVARMTGGVRYSGRLAGLDSGALLLSVGNGTENPLRLPMTMVTEIRLTGGRLTYLSDMTPVSVEQTPYLDRARPWRTDRDFTGGVIMVGGQSYEKGLAVRPRTRLSYELSGAAARFGCVVGFEQPAGRGGCADVRVRAGERVVFERLALRGDEEPVTISVELGDAATLTLEVDFGPGGDVSDRVLFAGARIVRP